MKTAYDLYRKAKDKLQKIANLPPTERSQLLTTKEGRKIILERDDLLQLILDHKMAVSQAINKIKTEEKVTRSKKKSRAKEDLEDEAEKDETEGEQRDLAETKDEEENIENNDEYPFVEEWNKVNEEQKEEAKEAPPTKVEIYTPKPDLESLYKAMPSIKKLVDEGKITEKDAEKIYDVWRNMEAIFQQASLLWYNTVDILLKKAGLSEKEREEIFYEMVRPYFRLFSKEEIFPKDVLEGKM